MTNSSSFTTHQKIAGYRLERFLGQGGFGEVWQAKSDGGVPVAVKFIRRLNNSHGDRERLALEHIKELKSDHLVTIRAIHCLDENQQIIEDERIATAKDDGQVATYVVAMDLGNFSLRNRLDECPDGLPLPELLEHLASIARAIDFLNHPKDASRLPIIHRDIKPENVLIFDGDSSYGKAKLCDYGIAHPLNPQMTQTETVAGDFRYIAPEQTRGIKDIKADQYSLAITYYELRFGVLPLDAQSSTSSLGMLVAHSRGHLDLSRASGNELAVLEKATYIEPEERYRNCLEFSEAIRYALAAMPPTGITAKRKGARRIQLDWQGYSHQTFEVWRSLGSSENGEKIVEIENGSRYLDENAPQHGCTYRVRAVNEVSQSAFRETSVERNRSRLGVALLMLSFVIMLCFTAGIAKWYGVFEKQPVPTPNPTPIPSPATSKKSTILIAEGVRSVKVSPDTHWRFEFMRDESLVAVSMAGGPQQRTTIPYDPRYRVAFHHLACSWSGAFLFVQLLDNPNDDLSESDKLYRLSIPIRSNTLPLGSEDTSDLSETMEIPFGAAETSLKTIQLFAVNESASRVACAYQLDASEGNGLRVEVWSSASKETARVPIPESWRAIKFATFLGADDILVLSDRSGEIAAFRRGRPYEQIEAPMRPPVTPRRWCKSAKSIDRCYYFDDHQAIQQLWEVQLTDAEGLKATRIHVDFGLSETPQMDAEGEWMLCNERSLDSSRVHLLQLRESRSWTFADSDHGQLQLEGKYAVWKHNGRIQIVDLAKLPSAPRDYFPLVAETEHDLLIHRDHVWILNDAHPGTASPASPAPNMLGD